MHWRMPAHRAVASGAVILLHIVFVLALWSATRWVEVERAIREVPVYLMFAPPLKKPAEKPRVVLPAPAPPLLLPPLPRAPLLFTPPPREEPDENGLSGLGRYLFNCSAMNYERLSARDWQHCLANNWQPYDSGKAPRLGEAAPNPWVQAPPEFSGAPMPRPCTPGEPTANLGLPCYTEPPHFPYR